MENENIITAFCPAFHKSVELIGKRWTGAILRAMRSGCVRFSDISDSVPGLHDRLLSERLKELESEGIVHRLVIPETPVRIEYRLTAKGAGLDNVMDAISQWAHDWIVPSAEDLDANLGAAATEPELAETLSR